MLVNGKLYRTIEASRKLNSVSIIDQTALPFEFKIIELKNLEDIITSIKNMQVRGAPLIGVTSAYGIALAMNIDSSDRALESAALQLMKSRPTAVNLAWAVNQMCVYLKNQDRKSVV